MSDLANIVREYVVRENTLVAELEGARRDLASYQARWHEAEKAYDKCVIAAAALARVSTQGKPE